MDPGNFPLPDTIVLENLASANLSHLTIRRSAAGATSRQASKEFVTPVG